VALDLPSFCLAAVLAAAPALGSGPVAGPPPLEDQNGKQDSLAAHHGRPVILLAAHGERLAGIQAWEAELRTRFDGLDFIRVVDVPQKPGTRPEGVVRKLRAKIPSEVPVLIDMDSVWASAYGLETSEVNVVLFDREGREVARFDAERDPALVESVTREIETGLGVPRKAPAPTP
jgi:hypothetical protein